MAKPKITLWFLNRIVHWDPHPLVDALSESFEVRIGRRCVEDLAPGVPGDFEEVVVNDGEEGAPGELMHEGAYLAGDAVTKYDEYFYPIPMKCAGAIQSPFWDSVASADGKVLLAALEGHLNRRFPPENQFNPDDAKKVIGPHFGDVRLNFTDLGMGYYEVLQKAKAQSGAMNVLVGYSQGGTVARYLAFLDEYVAAPGKRCIHGIVAVQSPNRGSSVASGDKKLAVSQALNGILLSFPKWLPDAFRGTPIWDYLGAASAKQPLIEFINGILDALIDTWKAVPGNDRPFETWLSARKWLSGLSGIEDLAFFDLDPARIAESGTVLSAIDRYPLNLVRHGAVIGTDSSANDLVHALVSGLGVLARLAAWWKADWIKDLLDQPDHIYKAEIMSLPPGTPGSLPAQYEGGLKRGPVYGLDKDIPPEAHDFVIPSVSQTLLPVTSAHLGNIVNEDASHLTGAICFKARDGKTDEDHVVALLRRL